MCYEKPVDLFFVCLRTWYLYVRNLLCANAILTGWFVIILFVLLWKLLYSIRKTVIKNAPDKGRGQPNVFTTE